MDFSEIANEINKIIETCIEYGRNEASVDFVYDAMEDLLYKMNADYEFRVDQFGGYIPQFTINED